MGECAIRVVSDDPRELCGGETFLGKLALLMLAVYGGGIPLAFAMLLRKHKDKLHTVDMITNYGFLYANYRREFFFWESVVLIRKMTTVLAVAMPQTPSEKIFMCTAVLFFFFIIHLTACPFRSTAQQNLETLALISLIISALILLYVEANVQ
eukprot:gene14496-biopygen12173